MKSLLAIMLGLTLAASAIACPPDCQCANCQADRAATAQADTNAQCQELCQGGAGFSTSRRLDVNISGQRVRPFREFRLNVAQNRLLKQAQRTQNLARSTGGGVSTSRQFNFSRTVNSSVGGGGGDGGLHAVTAETDTTTTTSRSRSSARGSNSARANAEAGEAAAQPAPQPTPAPQAQAAPSPGLGSLSQPPRARASSESY